MVGEDHVRDHRLGHAGDRDGSLGAAIGAERAHANHVHGGLTARRPREGGRAAGESDGRGDRLGEGLRCGGRRRLDRLARGGGGRVRDGDHAARSGTADSCPHGDDQAQRGRAGNQLLRESATAQPARRDGVRARLLVREFVGGVASRFIAVIAVIAGGAFATTVAATVLVLVQCRCLLVGRASVVRTPLGDVDIAIAVVVHGAERLVVIRGCDAALGAFVLSALSRRPLLAGVLVLYFLISLPLAVWRVGVLVVVVGAATHPLRASTCEYSLARAGSPTVSHPRAGRSAWPNHPQGRWGVLFGCAIGGVFAGAAESSESGGSRASLLTITP